MATLQPAGIRAVAEGVDKYVGDMNRMGGATAEMGSKLSRMAEIAGGMIAANVFGRLADAFVSAARGAAEFGKESILTAARVQELDAVLLTIGRTAGIPKQKLDDLVDSIVELGITTDVAQELVIKFARWNLNLADATKLARLAQDAAVISMQDSSEALDGLIHGITIMNTRVLRTYGITLASVTDAQDQYAEKIGKTRDELSETEMIQAVLNAVLAQGGQIAGAYEAAMETAGKQLRSMNRYVKELMINIGKPFLGAFTSVIKAASSWLKRFQELTKEGEVFNRILNAIASVVSRILVRAFDRMGDVFDLVMEHVNNLWQVIEAGYGVWGQLRMVFELFMNRTKPLHQEILPRLVELFQRYLLPIIEKVMKAFVFFAQAIALGQGPVHAMIEALSILVPRELVPGILKLHKTWDGFVSSIRDFLDKHKDNIIAGLKAIGLAITVYIVTSKVLNAIKMLGFLLGLLINPVVLVLAAIGALGIAWANNWGGIRDRLEDFWENTGRPVFEKIKAWLEEKIPKAFVFFAQAIALGLGPIHAMIEALSVLVPRELVPGILKLHETWDVFVSSIRDFLDKHKDNIVAGLKAIGLAITVYIVTSKVLNAIKVLGFLLGLLTNPVVLVLAAIGALGIAWANNWGGIRDRLADFWENTGRPIFEKIKAWLEEKIPEAIEDVVYWFEEKLPEAIGEAVRWFQEDLPVALEELKEDFQPIIDKAGELAAAFIESGPKIQEELQKVGDFIKNAFIPSYERMLENIAAALDQIKEFWQEHGDTIIEIVGTAMRFVLGTIAGIIAFITNVVTAGLALLRGDWEGFWDALVAAVEGFIEPILGVLGTNLEEVRATWERNINMWIEILAALPGRLFEIGKDIVIGLLEGLVDAWESIPEWLKKALDDIVGVMSSFLRLYSPSGLFEEIGQNMMAGLAKGIQSGAQLPAMAAQVALSQQVMPAVAGVTRNQEFNLNVSTSAPSEPVIADFQMLALLAELT